MVNNYKKVSMNFKTWLLLLALFVLCTNANAAETITFADRDIVSPSGSTIYFNLANGVAANEQARVVFEARTDYTMMAGSNAGLYIYANNNILIDKSQLLNKRMEYITRNEEDATWLFGAGWRTLYSNTFDNSAWILDPATLSPYAMPNPPNDNCEPYRFVLDITSFMNKAQGANNFVTFNFSCGSSTLKLRNISIVVGTPITAPPYETVTPAPTGALTTYVAQNPALPSMTASLNNNGSIKINTLAKDFIFTTKTSKPNSVWYTTNGNSTWNAITQGSFGSATWSTTKYRVDRKVYCYTDHVGVEDTFTNTTGGDVGIIYENRMAFPNMSSTPEIKVAGFLNCAPTWADYSPGNPTSIATWTNPAIAMGLIAEDDVMRVNIKSFTEPEVIGLSNPSLGLASGAVRTLKWSIYPIPGGDYWAFVNRARQNWNANYELPAIAFDHDNDGSKTAQYYTDWMDKRGLKWVIGSQQRFMGSEIAAWSGAFNPMNLAEGTMIPKAVTVCNQANSWGSKLGADYKVLSYLDTQICTDPETFPVSSTKYQDSQKLDSAGNRTTTPFSYPIYQYLTTNTSTYGTAMLSAINTFKNTYPNIDGFFNDEFSYSGPEINSYFGEWDGATMDINQSTHAIITRSSNTALLQQSWKAGMIDSLLASGKVIVGNGPAYTRTMLDKHVPMFAETPTFANVVDMHFSSPLGLGTHDAGANDMNNENGARMVRRLLDRGSLLVPYVWTTPPTASPHYISLMYPITPVELHSGMVIGTDRIITRLSGRYGFPDGSDSDVYVYDGNGQIAVNPDVLKVQDSGKWRSEIRMPSDHFAILIKKNETDAVPISYTIYPAPSVSFQDSSGRELIDNIIPSTSFNNSGWIGWYGWALSPWATATFDFGKNIVFDKVIITSLNDVGSGIKPLEHFDISYSTNGIIFTDLEHFDTTTAERVNGPVVMCIHRVINYRVGRFVKISAGQLNGSASYPWAFLGEIDFQGVVETLLTGKVNLLDFTGDITTIPVTIELNGAPHVLNIDADGKFTIPNIAAGTYDVRIKASHWLAKLTSGINVSGNTDIGIITLLNGDVVDNNEVDFSDINAVRSAYGSFPGDGNWNERADVDGTGEVDFTDINVVRSNYGEIGD